MSALFHYVIQILCQILVYSNNRSKVEGLPYCLLCMYLGRSTSLLLTARTCFSSFLRVLFFETAGQDPSCPTSSRQAQPFNNQRGKQKPEALFNKEGVRNGKAYSEIAIGFTELFRNKKTFRHFSLILNSDIYLGARYDTTLQY